MRASAVVCVPAVLLAVSILAGSLKAAPSVPRRSAGEPPQLNRVRLLNPSAPEFTQPAPARAIVRFETTSGNVLIEVLREWAPLGADRFINLVRYGYYDEARFFRVTVGRWIQFGVNGDPAVAQAWRRATFADEPRRTSNARGTVAFAFAVPNGRTTQVFVNMRDNSETHDREPFVPFGRVIEGMEVLDGLNAEHGEGPGGIRAGGQDAFFEGGNAWLDARFPRLDFIRTARLRD